VKAMFAVGERVIHASRINESEVHTTEDYLRFLTCGRAGNIISIDGDIAKVEFLEPVYCTIPISVKKLRHVDVLRLGGVNYETKTGAPWLATEIFTVGCHKRCEGCFNSQLQRFDAPARLWEVNELAILLHQQVPYRRLSISGGEPFLQARPLAKLIKRLRWLDKDWMVLCYSGYYLEELQTMPDAQELLDELDILVDGPFEIDKKIPDEEFTFVGSTNQRIIDMRRTLREGKIILYSL
jgi:anaerobic ribonucleoside-triphosphate reductase activating protein